MFKGNIDKIELIIKYILPIFENFEDTKNKY